MSMFPSDADQPQYFRPPRLGIIHLLAWTAATAVLLKSHVAAKDISVIPYLSEAGNVCYQAIQFLDSAAFGAASSGRRCLCSARPAANPDASSRDTGSF